MYHEARKEYELAYQLTHDYYPGINAATLAHLTDDAAGACKLAREVDQLCAEKTAAPAPGPVSDEERVWVFATQGEAQMILGDYPLAREHYAAALSFLEPTQGGMANSMYRQICRVWKLRGDALAPLLELFERHNTFARALSPNYLGRAFSLAATR
jgi:hypothetical protein